VSPILALRWVGGVCDQGVEELGRILKRLDLEKEKNYTRNLKQRETGSPEYTRPSKIGVKLV
jgi:hypothetical protein